MRGNFADCLEQHAQIVPHMQTAFLLRAAAQELRKKQEAVNTNFYIKLLPNGDFEVCYEDD